LKNWKDYPAQHVLHLRAVMKQLLVTCRFALALNKSQITVEQNDFQEACEDGYETISDALEPIFKEAAKAGKTPSSAALLEE
jgi:signal transduction histidine kinase